MGGKSQVPVVRAWQSRKPVINTLLVALVVLPVVLCVLGFAAADGSTLLVWGFITGVPGLVAAVLLLRVPEICPHCDEQVNPVCRSRELIGQEQGYGIETRTAHTYERRGPYDPVGGYYDATPSSETTYQASYPVLHKQWLLFMQCPRCGYKSTRQSTTTQRVG